MNKKIVGIFVCMLLIGTLVIPVSGNLNIKLEKIENDKTEIQYGESWYETFDLYENNQLLDGTYDDGGWKGWDNDPYYYARVVDDQFLSYPYSVEIAGSSDIVHQFWNYTYGVWYLTTWVYVPSSFEGISYFMVLDQYYHYGPYHFAVAIRFDDGGFVESDFDGETLPLITDKWVELRLEIDLDEDWLKVYYDDSMLVEKEWTAGVYNYGDGYLDIAAIDLYGAGGTGIYFDNILLCKGVIKPLPVLEIRNPPTFNLLKVPIYVTNSGKATANNIKWSLDIKPGDFFIPEDDTDNETIGSLGSDDEEKIEMKLSCFLKKKVTLRCYYTISEFNKSDCEVDVIVEKEMNDFGLFLVNGFFQGMQPTPKWETIDKENVIYEEENGPGGPEKYVKLIFQGINNMHNVRVVQAPNYDSDSTDTLFQSASKFEDGEARVEECHLTRDIVLSNNAYWQVETLNGQ